MSKLDIKFMTASDVKRMLDELNQEELEAILAEKFKNLDEKAKKRILGEEPSINVITGSFVSLNSEIAINFQNTSGFDAELLMKALVEFRKASKNNS